MVPAGRLPGGSESSPTTWSIGCCGAGLRACTDTQWRPRLEFVEVIHTLTCAGIEPPRIRVQQYRAGDVEIGTLRVCLLRCSGTNGRGRTGAHHTPPVD